MGVLVVEAADLALEEVCYSYYLISFYLCIHKTNILICPIRRRWIRRPRRYLSFSGHLRFISIFNYYFISLQVVEDLAVEEAVEGEEAGTRKIGTQFDNFFSHFCNLIFIFQYNLGVRLIRHLIIIVCFE